MNMPYSWIFFAAIALVFLGDHRGDAEACDQSHLERAVVPVVRLRHDCDFCGARGDGDPALASPAVYLLAGRGGAQVSNGLGALTSFKALESGGKASIVISLISLFPLLTVAFGVLALHEKLSLGQGVGVLLAIVAAILLSLEPAAL